MAQFQDIFGNFALVGLLVLAIFSLIFIVQTDNNATQPLAENVLINRTYTNLNDTMSSLESEGTNKYNLFSTEKPALGFGSIVLFTIVNAGSTFGNIIFIIFTLIIKVPLIVLGVDPTVTAMIISFLSISIIIALWIVYKFGG